MYTHRIPQKIVCSYKEAPISIRIGGIIGPTTTYNCQAMNSKHLTEINIQRTFNRQQNLDPRYRAKRYRLVIYSSAGKLAPRKRPRIIQDFCGCLQPRNQILKRILDHSSSPPSGQHRTLNKTNKS